MLLALIDGVDRSTVRLQAVLGPETIPYISSDAEPSKKNAKASHHL